MGYTSWFVDFMNVAVPWGEVLIGLGLGHCIEQYEIRGQPLVARHPWTRYILG